MSYLLAKDGTKYELTPKDIRTSLEVTVGEGEAATLQIMAQRFLLLRGKFKTFWELLEAYCQPIKPIWRRGGSMCKMGGKYHGEPECSEDKLKRRDFIKNASLEQLKNMNSKAFDEGLAWLNGGLVVDLPGVVHFAAPSLIQRAWINTGKVAERDVYKTVTINGAERTLHNWAFGDENGKTKDWPKDFVRVVGEKTKNFQETTTPPTKIIMGGVGVVGLGAFLAWLASS